MHPTYKAVLRGDRLEWSDEVPEQIRSQAKVAVFVTIVGDTSQVEESRGRRMADALARLAARGGPVSIDDPSAWQREQREERPLPGRER